MFTTAKFKIQEQRILSKYRKVFMDNCEFRYGKNPFKID